MSGKYLVARNAFGDGDLSWSRDTIVAQLLSARYAFDERHEKVPADGFDGFVGNPLQLTNRRMNEGWCTCDEMVFGQVRGAVIVAILFYRMTDGLPIEYHTAADKFPITPNGGDIHIDVAAPGIFRN